MLAFPYTTHRAGAGVRGRGMEGAEGTMKKLALLLAACAVIALVGAPAAQAADGKALFEGKCAMCHGKDGVAKPMAKGSANFNDAKWQAATKVEAIETVITDGKGKMKGYKDKMSAEEIKAVAAYVKTIK
jgi:cytochrome c6